ncbi:MAG: hypothetical protein ABIY70_08615 [Capsulimonas sp.]|uniref:hypothetical protein n=1 Tax=Capsulimonas sp. TaxID=2494211 RepID=UPI003266E526
MCSRRAQNLARQKAHLIESDGNSVFHENGESIKLPTGEKVKATKKDDLRTLSRYIATDGLDQADDRPVVFEFAGVVYDTKTLVRQDIFVQSGVVWRIDSVHPQERQDICTLYATVCHRK